MPSLMFRAMVAKVQWLERSFSLDSFVKNKTER
jgi:hypothetical protein